MLLLFNKRHTLCIGLFVLFITISWHRYTPYPPSSQWFLTMWYCIPPIPHLLIGYTFYIQVFQTWAKSFYLWRSWTHSHSCLGNFETKWSRAEHRFGGIWKDYGWCKWIIVATIREPLRPNYNLCGFWIRSDAICNVCLIFTSSANVCLKYLRCLASKRALGFNSFHVSSLT